LQQQWRWEDEREGHGETEDETSPPTFAIGFLVYGTLQIHNLAGNVLQPQQKETMTESGKEKKRL